MTFVFQNSKEMPVQKNFIDDLINFLDLIEKILPIENKAIELNSQIKKEEERFEKESLLMTKFSNELNDSMENLLKNYQLEPVNKCKVKINETSVDCIEKQKEQMKIALDDLTRRSKDEVSQMAEQIRIELEPFLWSRIYNMNKTQLITASAENLNGSITMNINGLSFNYNITYNEIPLMVKKFIDEISIPIWSKGGLIHKEDRIKKLDISEYFIKRIYKNDDFQMDLENKKGTKKVNIKLTGEIKHASIMYIDEGVTDITSSEDLLPQVNFYKLGELILGIKEYFDDEANIGSKILTSVEIDEKDAIASNEIFDSIKIIASQYGEIVTDILNNGFTKEEIVIKEIIKDGTRNEIFISVNDISNRLSTLGGEGLELIDLLNLH
jgi:Fe-S-cluster formation regulator IscX/YfhJ